MSTKIGAEMNYERSRFNTSQWRENFTLDLLDEWMQPHTFEGLSYKYRRGVPWTGEESTSRRLDPKADVLLKEVCIRPFCSCVGACVLVVVCGCAYVCCWRSPIALASPGLLRGRQGVGKRDVVLLGLLLWL